MDEIVSGFGDINPASGESIDFQSARRLKSSGSACEAWVARLQRRRVFVKRLRPELRDNPVYLDALDKEFDIGVSLSHRSLPRYIEFQGDYIVMDFVEGDTLASLISNHDQRLGDRKFVRKILSELLDVVEYLHNNKVVHCDIKPDNIIISPHADRPLVLIDLDKAYTDSLDTTAGNPALYNCDNCADGRVDFSGIGIIAGRLGMKRVARVAAHGDVTIQQLRAAVTPTRWLKPVLITAPVVAVAALTAILSSGDKDVPAPSPHQGESVVETPDEPVTDTIVKETLVEVQSNPAPARRVVDAEKIKKMINARAPSLDKLYQQAMAIETHDSISCARVHAITTEYGNEMGRLMENIVAANPGCTITEVYTSVHTTDEWKHHRSRLTEMLDHYNELLREFFK